MVRTWEELAGDQHIDGILHPHICTLELIVARQGFHGWYIGTAHQLYSKAEGIHKVIVDRETRARVCDAAPIPLRGDWVESITAWVSQIVARLQRFLDRMAESRYRATELGGFGSSKRMEYGRRYGVMASLVIECMVPSLAKKMSR